MPQSKGVILVVDDEKGVLNLLSVILTHAGYEVLTADSGYAGYSVLQKRLQGMGAAKVDLIISDWKMEGWDGLRLLTEVREGPFREIPFILMSGAVTRDELQNAARKQADGILVKPIDKAVVPVKVGEVIEKRKKK